MVTLRSASRSCVVLTKLLLAAPPVLMAEMGFVPRAALVVNVALGRAADNAGGVTTKVMTCVPAATVRLPILQVMVVPAKPLPPPQAPGRPPGRVEPAGTPSVS